LTPFCCARLTAGDAQGVSHPVATQQELRIVTPMATVNEVVKKCKMALESHYGTQLKGVILYGSTARNQADSMSDI